MRPFDPSADYPLGSERPDLITTPSGMPLGALTVDALVGGTIPQGDLRATAETLGMQAAVARANGRADLAENLERAAELTAIPDEMILDIYTALRPRRSSAHDLEALATRLEHDHLAVSVAAFIREAAVAYADRGLLA
ncbi:glycerol dehydrogenase [bacterium]|nr:glycerol dehydrogenase [bacterium]